MRIHHNQQMELHIILQMKSLFQNKCWLIAVVKLIGVKAHFKVLNRLQISVIFIKETNPKKSNNNKIHQKILFLERHLIIPQKINSHSINSINNNKDFNNNSIHKGFNNKLFSNKTSNNFNSSNLRVINSSNIKVIKPISSSNLKVINNSNIKAINSSNNTKVLM